MKKLLLILFVLFNICLSRFDGLVDAYAIEINDSIPDLFIKAINPGYTIDGKNNVGEMIEIGRKKSDAPISLASIAVGYTNSSGNYSILFEFPENSFMTGESILLRLASSPDSELAAVNYTKTIAFKAGISLVKGEEIIDSICWTGKDSCLDEFKSSNPTTIVRNLENNVFEHLDEYYPTYNENNYYIEKSQEEATNEKSQCENLVFSEVLSYYETFKTEQFIEFYNSGSEQILLDGCKLKYKNKNYELKGIVRPEEFFVYYPTSFSLTKNPTNKNVLELIDVNGEEIDKIEYPNGQRKAASYALLGYDKEGKEIWKVTYAPTPGSENNYQEFKTCEEGKIINKETGNCVKITKIAEKICGEGQYLNILTGRCKKYEENTEKTCKEGYYLNPETNRCRKIKENNGADYNLKPEKYEENQSFIALFAIIGVIILGLFYVLYEFRNEIRALLKKIKRPRK